MIPQVGISLMTDGAFRRAAAPLLEDGWVDLLEWSFDTAWGIEPPAWASALLDRYEGRLLGHGVTLSPLSGAMHERQHLWLECFARECRQRSYRQVSEHFGFVTAGAFDDGPPLPVPMTRGALCVGRDRLARLADLAGVPVGLENLAFAFGEDDVARQGEFLDALLEPVGGFLLLDLHNLYCHAHNFGRDGDELLERYPLHRVRELHVSGGSWSGAAPVRRDTHDGPVPDEVFRLLEVALRRCPDVESVVLEQIGSSLATLQAAHTFRRDFARMRKIARKVAA